MRKVERQFANSVLDCLDAIAEFAQTTQAILDQIKTLPAAQQATFERAHNMGWWPSQVSEGVITVYRKEDARKTMTIHSDGTYTR